MRRLEVYRGMVRATETADGVGAVENNDRVKRGGRSCGGALRISQLEPIVAWSASVSDAFVYSY